MKKILKRIITVLGVCLGLGVGVSRVEKLQGKVGWVEGHKPYGFYEKNVKRALDFGISLFALIVFSPVMAVTGIFVRLWLGKPIIFRQKRPGLGGRNFVIQKFRTMRDGEGSDEERLTGFGKKLRSSSLDELLELINILEGSMSVVGPRPLLVEYLDRYSGRQKHRHDVRPGLTGLAQVSGRNELSWDEKFDDDLEYIGKISFLLDMRIVLKTIVIVIRKKGVSSKTSETMEVFTGSEE